MPKPLRKAGFILTGLVILGLSIVTPARATIFTFNADPFGGSTALTTPGRQVVGGELLIDFSIANDVFQFDPAFFAVGNQVNFVSALATNLPSGGVNVVVLQDTPVALAAGSAADLIAAQITTDGAGFFVYFNTGLEAPRLVYSVNLNDNTADLKVLARMQNLEEDALPQFTAANFSIAAVAAVPEPSSLFLMTTVGGLLIAGARRRRAVAR
jgi:hypothetical protein